jgi:hypothetical protein
MRILDEAGRRMAGAGGELRIALANPNKRRHLRAANCDKYLRIFDSLTDALDAPQRNRALQPQAA